jgi:hypothetical protein
LIPAVARRRRPPPPAAARRRPPQMSPRVNVCGRQVVVCIFELGEFYKVAIARANGMQNQDASFQSARLKYADLQTRARDIVHLDPPATSKDDAYTRSNTGLFHSRDPSKDYKPFVKLVDGSGWVSLDTHLTLVWESAPASRS